MIVGVTCEVEMREKSVCNGTEKRETEKPQAPQSLKKRASQALLSHVDLPPERGSDRLSTVNICHAPVSLSIVMLTGITFPVLNWVGTPSTVVGPSVQIFFVEIYHVCPIDSLKKKLKFYRIIYTV